MVEINFFNEDCRPAIRKMKNDEYDLAIVDPPYYSGPEKRKYYGNKVSPIGVKRRDYKHNKSWQIPDEKYFDQLFRISKNQIIWGCNYFNYRFPGGRIIWDKVNDKSFFSDCEIAFNSLNNRVDLIRYMWNGMFQGQKITTDISESKIQKGNKSLNEIRIHPTQNPVPIYKWILEKYAEKGFKILDTHGGSMSIAIACYDLGFDLDIYEIDKEHFDNAVKRFEIYKSQLKINFNS